MPDTILFIEQEVIRCIKNLEGMHITTLILTVTRNLDFFGLENQVEAVVINMLSTRKILQDNFGAVYLS